MLYMILTGDRYLGLDIWPKILDEAKSITDKMKII